MNDASMLGDQSTEQSLHTKQMYSHVQVYLLYNLHAPLIQVLDC